MITCAKALSKATMLTRKKEMLERTDVVVISIIDPFMDWIFPVDKDNILNLWCHDIQPVTACVLTMEYFPMELQQAEKIFQLIKKYDDLEEKYILFVNCSAGICRSGAVVEFARRYCGLDATEFLSINSHIQPNEWILNLLCYLMRLEQIEINQRG